jgi:hypothetical protein
MVLNRFCLGILITAVCATAQSSLPDLFPFPNGSGLLQNHNTSNQPIPLTGAFLQSLGTNGRSCSTCHRPAEGFAISAAEVSLRFLLSGGPDPIFRTNDGSNWDQNVDVSTLEGRRKAFSLLTSRGLIRIALSPRRVHNSPLQPFRILTVAGARRRCRRTGARCHPLIFAS